MRNLVVKLTALAAMSLTLAAGAYQFSRPVAAAAQLCSNSCYRSCQQNYIFCRDNPDGYWDNGYAGGPCSEFVSTDFCCKWECPNTMSTYSRCTSNPTLSGCAQGTDPLQQYCSDAYQSSCSTQCMNMISVCPRGGRCAQAVISSPVGYQCSCTYTVECYP